MAGQDALARKERDAHVRSGCRPVEPTPLPFFPVKDGLSGLAIRLPRPERLNVDAFAVAHDGLIVDVSESPGVDAIHSGTDNLFEESKVYDRVGIV